jgi:hypothetical protein
VGTKILVGTQPFLWKVQGGFLGIGFILVMFNSWKSNEILLYIYRQIRMCNCTYKGLGNISHGEKNALFLKKKKPTSRMDGLIDIYIKRGFGCGEGIIELNFEASK